MLPNSAEIESCKTKRTKFLANAGSPSPYRMSNILFPWRVVIMVTPLPSTIRPIIWAFSPYLLFWLLQELVSLIFGYNGYHFPFVCHIKGVKPEDTAKSSYFIADGKTASCISMPQFEADDISLSTVQTALVMSRMQWISILLSIRFFTIWTRERSRFLYCSQSPFAPTLQRRGGRPNCLKVWWHRLFGNWKYWCRFYYFTDTGCVYIDSAVAFDYFGVSRNNFDSASSAASFIERQFYQWFQFPLLPQW